jgi:hypothetical protein
MESYIQQRMITSLKISLMVKYYFLFLHILIYFIML